MSPTPSLCSRGLVTVAAFMLNDCDQGNLGRCIKTEYLNDVPTAV